ncbi:MAG: sigma 54-interacting transcriptional regulator [Planctomycetota bacterium]
MIDDVLILDRTDHDLRLIQEEFRALVPGGQSLIVPLEEALDLLHDKERRELVLVPYSSGEDVPCEDLLRELRTADPTAPIVVAADAGDVSLVARSIHAGATDFLVLGDQLRERLSTLLGKLRGLFDVLARNRALNAQNAELRATVERSEIVGTSDSVRALHDTIQRVAAVPRPLLIVGERGTGKELIARAIHNAARASGDMITVNCAAFGDALLESELFGHEKGAFTGAATQRLGRFEQAHGGTLFLDEIGNMALPFQQKILRVVEYGTFHRVGGTTEVQTDCRIIAATNANLRERIQEGAFLSDLYDRLSFEVIESPALRDRKGDIAVLARHFLEEFASEIPAFRGKALSTDAIEYLEQYPFPGNVRELKNIIERAAYRDTSNEITSTDLHWLEAIDPCESGSFKERVDRFSANLIREALQQSGGNQADAARKLDLTYAQFRYYRQKLLGTESSEEVASS